MGQYSRIILSGSTAGQGIPVTGVLPSQGTVIHTAVTGAAGSIDEVYLWAFNTATLARDISLSIGPTTATGSRFTDTLPAGELAGLQLVMPGLSIQATTVVKAWVTVADAVNIFGHVNRFAS
jgi:hypothetical protein|tara:strand:+ start:3691 stop:4056 length:366 start_codon:yes stop_codon:yes gene_type:complete